ncbi:MAG TPA: trimethylamine methyltransferase family protein [Armatimonadota bacterium]|nr:trimethylamine methyltransferase family protein [Armatimonadota bacterium]
MIYAYPEYGTDLTPELLDRCCDLGARLAAEVGLVVRHDGFLDAIRGKPGVRIEGERVHFDVGLLRANIERYQEGLRRSAQGQRQPPQDRPWTMACGGFSMEVIDIETEEVRPATCQDLRDLIKLVNSFGIGGNYPVMPQDLPPLLRALACFRICWQEADNIRPYDYQHRSQTPFLYEMHQVMGKPFDITLCVVQPMMIDDKDLDIFLDFYPRWKTQRNIQFHILDYPMMGITKPVTATATLAMYVAEMFSVYTLFRTFDPELEVPVRLHAGLMTDLRHT